MASKDAREWLLEEDQPAVRYLALTTLQGKPETAPEVRAANAQISTAMAVQAFMGGAD